MAIEATERKTLEDFYLTAAEVAEMLRKSVDTLANERSRGEGLPYVRHGGKVLYRSADVLKAMNAGLQGFTWARLESSLRRYGMPDADVGRLVAHLKRDM